MMQHISCMIHQVSSCILHYAIWCQMDVHHPSQLKDDTWLKIYHGCYMMCNIWWTIHDIWSCIMHHLSCMMIDNEWRMKHDGWYNIHQLTWFKISHYPSHTMMDNEYFLMHKAWNWMKHNKGCIMHHQSSIMHAKWYHAYILWWKSMKVNWITNYA